MYMIWKTLFFVSQHLGFAETGSQKKTRVMLRSCLTRFFGGNRGGTCHEHGPVNVDGEEGPPHCGGCVCDTGEIVHDAGAVDEDVEAAEVFVDVVHGGFGFFFDGDVVSEIELVVRLGFLGLGDVDARDFGAVREEERDDGGADAGGAACDEADLGELAG